MDDYHFGYITKLTQLNPTSKFKKTNWWGLITGGSCSPTEQLLVCLSTTILFFKFIFLLFLFLFLYISFIIF
jgi:hypothetical protein